MGAWIFNDPKKAAELMKMRKEGATTRELVAHFHCVRSTILAYLRRHGMGGKAVGFRNTGRPVKQLLPLGLLAESPQVSENAKYAHITNEKLNPGLASYRDYLEKSGLRKHTGDFTITREEHAAMLAADREDRAKNKHRWNENRPALSPPVDKSGDNSEEGKGV